MKKRKHFWALMLTAALLLSLTACGKKEAGSKTAENTNMEADAEKKENPEEPEPEKIDPLAAARKNIAAAASMDARLAADMAMEISINGEKQSVESAAVIDMSCFYEPAPMRMKMDLTLNMGEAGSITRNIYTEADADGAVTMYLYDGFGWQSKSVDTEAAGQYDAGSKMAVCLSPQNSFKEAGIEQIDNVNAYKYKGVITGDNRKKILSSSGALDALGYIGIDFSQMETVPDDLGEIPFELWIDEESLYPVQYEADITKAADALTAGMAKSIEEWPEGMSMNISEVKIKMTCFHYNEATEFSIPDEAKNR